MASPDVQIQKRWLSRRWRLSLTCVSIALNAATAAGIFTFPLISESADIGRFRLTQPQISSIVLAGMTMGQYPAAPFVGSVIDRIGPWACSLASAVLFSTGFGLFSLEFRNTPEHPEHGPSKWSFYRLMFFYFLAGLGTVTSYFSALFSAQKNFPKYSGLAAGASMALFGLSPLILSLFASAWFTDPERGLRVADFTAFLAILTGAIHLLGAINLHVETQVDQLDLPTPPNEGTADDVEAATERTPLIRPDGKKLQSTFSAWEILNDYDFWILATATLLTLGACEMVVANIGTISLALPPKEATSGIPFIASNSTVSTATTQVRLLSLSNTISRLTSGPMADFVSPVASYLPSGLLALPHKHKISRVVFLLGSCLLMSLSFLWMVFGVTTRQGIWAFSIGIGIAYGATFTVLPSLIASIWGTASLARNFGLITYAPFIGTPAFSYLYAFIASAATESKDPDGYSEGACFGKQCWRLTFLIGAAGGFAAAFCSIVLWKKWHGRL